MESDTFTYPLLLLETLEPENEGKLWIDASDLLLAYPSKN